ncbi:hypothetical protein NQF87_01735 [Bombella sp. TMW 2.2559]|uniref:Uncharacterized protein n=1 Tax=Bombella dulcis TaxID=2967339 RepID=A0ABT3W9D2_9PROT|nr:hypothetical protein [Bombella dulcis]MCX5615702.1 hypothetical protein [Bombella dulcis]
MCSDCGLHCGNAVWLLTRSGVRYTCPPLVQYSHEEQAVLASELRAHPELIEVPVFLTDYGNERAECRALNTNKAG